MKNYGMPFISLLLAISIQSCYINLGESVSGNGHVVEETRSAGDFHSLKVSSGIDVFINQGENEFLRLEADENLLEHIKTEITDGELKIYTDVNIRMAKSKKVYLGYKQLKSIHISSAGDVNGENAMHSNDLKLRLSSAGDLKLEVIADEIDLDISSSGNVTLAGKTGYLKAGLSSAGNLNAFDLQAARADVSVSSAGDARIYVTDEARFKCSSAGDIVYRGNPKILDMHTSSAGDIRKKD
ncbi:MAG TPA: head GIN domain-containing protein [Bacteroidales bacterium]|nr:head GIN domain-containing protein [Bacteroidales bacterium]